jgi:hypothetical protein
MAESIVCIHHIFSIHSSVVGHLGCFQSLAIVNSAKINVGVQVALLFPAYIPLGICPRVVLLDLMVGLLLVF